MSNDKALIAQIGRTIGLWGDLKFHLHTDFPEQFTKGKTYTSSRGDLTISDINAKRGTIRFVGYESIDSAKKLTNVKIFANEAETKEHCTLKEGQYFWFDMIACEILEDERVLGTIKEVQRMADIDYLLIQTDDILVKEGATKSFLVPYIDRYVLNVDIEAQKVYTKDAKDILATS